MASQSLIGAGIAKVPLHVGSTLGQPVGCVGPTRGVCGVSDACAKGVCRNVGACYADDGKVVGK